MAKYFNISVGLRGGYMPDNSYVVKVNTRRELKDAIESEAYSIRDAGFVGCSKRAVAWLANVVWREAKKKSPAYLPYVCEYRKKTQTHYPYGIFASVSNRNEYLEHIENAE